MSPSNIGRRRFSASKGGRGAGEVEGDCGMTLRAVNFGETPEVRVIGQLSLMENENE